MKNPPLCVIIQMKHQNFVVSQLRSCVVLDFHCIYIAYLGIKVFLQWFMCEKGYFSLFMSPF